MAEQIADHGRSPVLRRARRPCADQGDESPDTSTESRHVTRLIERKGKRHQRPPRMPDHDRPLGFQSNRNASGRMEACAAAVQCRPRGRSLWPKSGRSKLMVRYRCATWPITPLISISSAVYPLPWRKRQGGPRPCST